MTDAPNIEFTPPCLGSVGSQPYLHDVQNQLNENFHANREGRDPKILPIACGFCQGYHEANQLDAATVFKGTDYDQYAYNRIVPQEPNDTYITNDLLRAAHMAVNGGVNPFPEDSQEEAVDDGSE